MTDEVTFKRRSGYTAVPNAIFSDERLSMDARGFLGLLMSFKEGWVFRRSHLMLVSKFGRDKYYKVLGQLEEVGYLKKYQTKDGSGQWSGISWEVIDAPIQDVASPCTENTETVVNMSPCTGLPYTGNTAYGESGHIRETNKNKKPNKKSCAKAHKKLFIEFYEKHPRPRNETDSEELFFNAIENGIDPDWIVLSAKKYSIEQHGNQPRFISYSDNWLADQRWQDFPAKAAAPQNYDQAVFYAEAVKKKSALARPSMITIGLAQEMLQRELVTAIQLKELGIYF